MYVQKKNQALPYAALYMTSILFLLIIGIVFVYSASSIYAFERIGQAHYYAIKHLIGLILGLISLIICYLIPIRAIEKNTNIIFFTAFFLTALTMFPNLACTIHGSSRWLHLGIITFQPSELLKYAFVLFIASFFAKKSKFRIQKTTVYMLFLTILAITSFPLLMQPDFGMTVTICLTGIMVAFITGVQLKHLTRTMCALVPIALFLIYLKPYRIKRILTFVDPWADPQGTGFQIIQSFIAIGSGSLYGVGIGQSKQKFFYLPMQHTDFIFSIIAEETGFVGALFVIFLFTFFLNAGLRLAFMQQNLFGRYAMCGFVILLSLQALINIAVATGLVPTKGIGLPFISYGNSSLVSTLAMVGLMFNIIKKHK